MIVIPREDMSDYPGVKAWREVYPGWYAPAEPLPEQPEFRLGGMLRRGVLLLLIIMAASVVREFWPWFPYLGVAMGLSYAVGRRFE